MKKKIYKVGGLFSGVGGIELGFSDKEKFKIVWGTDFDNNASKTYRKNFSHPFYEIDINELKGHELEEVDVLVGGFPCQAFSVAVNKKNSELFIFSKNEIDDLPINSINRKDYMKNWENWSKINE